jgi:hypothetical protein
MRRIFLSSLCLFLPVITLPTIISFAQAQSTITIGEPAVLSASDGQNGNLLLAQQATLSQPATVNSLSFYVIAADGELRLGLYDATGPNGGPGVLQAQANSFTPVAGWNTVSAVTSVVLPAGNYWLAYMPSSNGLGFVKQNNSGSCYYYSQSFSDGFPSTFSTAPQNCTPTTWSFYATLTPAGAAAISGACGSSNGAALTSAPSTNLCATGTASSVSGSGPWTWSCAGSNGGTTAQCTASVAAAPVNGACGSAITVPVNAAPTSNLCTTGLASVVSGSGPWTWTCAGSNGGTTALCSAPLASSSGSGSGGGTTGSGASILPAASNASANWQMAGMLSVGGIPNRTTVCGTVSPVGSGADDSNNINNAITACPSGQVVLLAPGTFTIAEGNFVLVNNSITLRGSGPGTTILTRPGGATLGSYEPGSNPSPMIILGPQEYNNGETATLLTADADQGAASVEVTSASGFSVGQIVQIDEASGAQWMPDVEGLGQIWAAPDYRVVWQKHNPPQPDIDDFAANQYPYQAGTAGCWFSNCDRPTTEYHKISAISGNTITFDSPLTISYRVAHQAQLYYFQTPFLENAGVEQMTVEHGDDDNIDFNWCAYCWAYQVENTLWLGDGFGVNNSFRVELNEFYNHEPVWPVPGGGGYNISLANGSSEILMWNGISVLANKVMVARASGAGSVVAYNYMDMGFISGTDAWQEIGLNSSHYVGSHHTLFEGNRSFNMDSDQTHGNSIYHTFFRNYTTGFRAQFTDYLNGVVVNDIAQQSANGPLRSAAAHAYAYGFSFIGNVLGVPGEMGNFIYGDVSNLGNGNWPPQIFMMGWNDLPNQVYDPTVIGTADIDGNCDYLTNRVNWASTDTAHTLPNSLFLTQAPAFFGAGSGYTWPPVNPLGATSQFYTLPAYARYQAGTPFTQP